MRIGHTLFADKPDNAGRTSQPQASVPTAARTEAAAGEQRTRERKIRKTGIGATKISSRRRADGLLPEAAPQCKSPNSQAPERAAMETKLHPLRAPFVP